MREKERKGRRMQGRGEATRMKGMERMLNAEHVEGVEEDRKGGVRQVGEEEYKWRVLIDGGRGGETVVFLLQTGQDEL